MRTKKNIVHRRHSIKRNVLDKIKSRTKKNKGNNISKYRTNINRNQRGGDFFRSSKCKFSQEGISKENCFYELIIEKINNVVTIFVTENTEKTVSNLYNVIKESVSSIIFNTVKFRDDNGKLFITDHNVLDDVLNFFTIFFIIIISKNSNDKNKFLAKFLKKNFLSETLLTKVEINKRKVYAVGEELSLLFTSVPLVNPARVGSLLGFNRSSTDSTDSSVSVSSTNSAEDISFHNPMYGLALSTSNPYYAQLVKNYGIVDVKKKSNGNVYNSFDEGIKAILAEVEKRRTGQKTPSLEELRGQLDELNELLSETPGPEPGAEPGPEPGAYALLQRPKSPQTSRTGGTEYNKLEINAAVYENSTILNLDDDERLKGMLEEQQGFVPTNDLIQLIKVINRYNKARDELRHSQSIELLNVEVESTDETVDSPYETDAPSPNLLGDLLAAPAAAPAAVEAAEAPAAAPAEAAAVSVESPPPPPPPPAADAAAEAPAAPVEAPAAAAAEDAAAAAVESPAAADAAAAVAAEEAEINEKLENINTAITAKLGKFAQFKHYGLNIIAIKEKIKSYLKYKNNLNNKDINDKISKITSDFNNEFVTCKTMIKLFEEEKQLQTEEGQKQLQAVEKKKGKKLKDYIKEINEFWVFFFELSDCRSLFNGSLDDNENKICKLYVFYYLEILKYKFTYEIVNEISSFIEKALNLNTKGGFRQIGGDTVVKKEKFSDYGSNIIKFQQIFFKMYNNEFKIENTLNYKMFLNLVPSLVSSLMTGGGISPFTGNLRLNSDFETFNPQNHILYIESTKQKFKYDKDSNSNSESVLTTHKFGIDSINTFDITSISEFRTGKLVSIKKRIFSNKYFIEKTPSINLKFIKNLTSSDDKYVKQKIETYDDLLEALKVQIEKNNSINNKFIKSFHDALDYENEKHAERLHKFSYKLFEEQDLADAVPDTNLYSQTQLVSELFNALKHSVVSK